MTESFKARVEKFININHDYVCRVLSKCEWFVLRNSIVFHTDTLESLVIPVGLHLEVCDSSKGKNYFLVDNYEPENSEELISSEYFWDFYAEEYKRMKSSNK